MPDGPNGTGVRAGQDERVRRITTLVQRLLADVARSGYGERAGFPYMTPPCSAELRRALAAMRVEGGVIEADYGEQAQATAYLPETAGPVRVELVVDDRSVLRAPNGQRMPLPSACWLLDLALDSRCSEVLSLSVAPV